MLLQQVKDVTEEDKYGQSAKATKDLFPVNIHNLLLHWVCKTLRCQLTAALHLGFLGWGVSGIDSLVDVMTSIRTAWIIEVNGWRLSGQWWNGWVCQMRSTRRPLLEIAIGACRCCGVPARQVNSALVFARFWMFLVQGGHWHWSAATLAHPRSLLLCCRQHRHWTPGSLRRSIEVLLCWLSLLWIFDDFCRRHEGTFLLMTEEHSVAHLGWKGQKW